MRSAGLLMVSRYAGSAFGLLTSIAAARLLTPAQFGLAAVVMAYPSLLRKLVEFKSAVVTIRYIAGFRATKQFDDLCSVAKIGFAVDFGMAFISFVAVVATIRWVGRETLVQPGLIWLSVVFAASFPFVALTRTGRAILISWGSFRTISLLNMFESAVTLTGVLVLLLLGAGVAGLVLGMALGNVSIGLATLVAATITLRRAGVGWWWSGHLKGFGAWRREIAGFFGWNFLEVTLGGLRAQIPILILGRLAGAADAGFFRMANTLMSAGSFAEGSLRDVVYPQLAGRWATGDRATLLTSVSRWTAREGLVAAGIMVVLAVALPVLVPLVIGRAYAPMVPGAQIMILGGAVGSLLFWVGPLLQSAGRYATLVQGLAVYTAYILLFAWPVIARWGFSGLAVLVMLGDVLFILAMAAIIIRGIRRFGPTATDAARLPAD